jgi:UDP-N-acetylmuramoylalanine--D-glutamate ligase
MRTLVIGLGSSGQAAVRLLLSRGKEVVSVDKNATLLAEDENIERLRRRGVVTLLEAEFTQFADVEQVVLSSGVRPLHPFCSLAKEREIEVVGEAELALSASQQPCIAITGTNGKTTVTLLVEHLLKKMGLQARVLGNVGDPLAHYFCSPDTREILVVELSSYQLETLRSPVFDVGVILNITPDHLDTYASLDEYAAAKCRLQNLLKPGAPLYINQQITGDFPHLLKKDLFKTFGRSAGSHLWTDHISAKDDEKIAYFIPLRYRDLGVHERENILAAWALTRRFGVTQELFLEALETFEKPPHRIEFVAEIDGVSYFDDSKGTNIDAVIQAVNAMKGDVVLIVGGVDKGSSYLPWAISFQKRIKSLIALGEAAHKIASELSSFYQVEIVASMDEAVICAAERAEKGDSVLLSPGCASFDMFRSYAERGKVFKSKVQSLKKSKRGEDHHEP